MTRVKQLVLLGRRLRFIAKAVYVLLKDFYYYLFALQPPGQTLQPSSQPASGKTRHVVT
jgi:hypothetical protein